jgi:hypothetical protein
MEMVTIISNMIHLGNTQNIEKDRFVRHEDHVFDESIWNIRQRNGQQAKSSLSTIPRRNVKLIQNLHLMVFKRWLVHIFINNGNMD